MSHDMTSCDFLMMRILHSLSPRFSFLMSSAHRFLMKPTTARTSGAEEEGWPRMSEERDMPPCVHITGVHTCKYIVRQYVMWMHIRHVHIHALLEEGSGHRWDVTDSPRRLCTAI